MNPDIPDPELKTKNLPSVIVPFPIFPILIGSEIVLAHPESFSRLGARSTH